MGSPFKVFFNTLLCMGFLLSLSLSRTYTMNNPYLLSNMATVQAFNRVLMLQMLSHSYDYCKTSSQAGDTAGVDCSGGVSGHVNVWGTSLRAESVCVCVCVQQVVAT